MKGYLIISLISIICLFNSCSSENSPNQNNSRYPDAESQNIDQEGLINAYNIISGLSYTTSLIVERNGVIVQEEYFNGYTSERFIDVKSTTKSIISIMYGIAIEQGFIIDVDETISDYISDRLQNVDSEKGQITIQNLLMMASGLSWHELGYTDPETISWRQSEDPITYVLSKTFTHTPGEYMQYNTGAYHILIAILTAATEMSAKEFTQQYLFNHLDAEVGDWAVDNFGINHLSMSIRPRDMIKIGRLMLNGGNWNGTQIVAEDWVNESTRLALPSSETLPYDPGYGYLWWRGYDENNGISFYYASGSGGQFIINMPASNTIIVATTTSSTGIGDMSTEWTRVLSIIAENIFPAIR